MTPTANFKRWFQGAPRKVQNPLKLTALLYLREALLQEKYEECAEIIGTALELGASATEIHYLLEDPRRNPAR